MKKRLLVVLLIILLTLAYTIASTYAVIINVKSESGVNEIINKITIKDLLTGDNNEYNETYYDVKNTLDITEEEMNILINSKELDKKLQIVLNKIVDYKINKNFIFFLIFSHKIQVLFLLTNIHQLFQLDLALK